MNKTTFLNKRFYTNLINIVYPSCITILLTKNITVLNLMRLLTPMAILTSVFFNIMYEVIGKKHFLKKAFDHRLLQYHIYNN